MDKAKELDRLDKKMARTKELQKELDHRTEVEEKVFKLFSEGKFEEGKALLDTLDDEKVMELAEGDVAAEEDKKIEIYINCHTDLSKGNLKRRLDRVTEETRDYPYAKIRVVIS